MSILIKNNWPGNSNLFLQCSGVSHDFTPTDRFWLIQGEELDRVLGPYNQGQLSVGAYNNPASYITVKNGYEYTFGISED